MKLALTCPSCRESFRGVSSGGEIARLADRGRAFGADLVVALGGGAAIDAGKAVSHVLGREPSGLRTPSGRRTGKREGEKTAMAT